MNELLDEGAVQMLRDRNDDGSGTPILAAVGALQLDVVEYRLKNEYTVDCKMDALTYTQARWVVPDISKLLLTGDMAMRDPNGIQYAWHLVDQAEKAGKLFGVYICQDRWQRPVLLFRNPWKITQLQEESKELQLAPWAMPPKEYYK